MIDTLDHNYFDSMSHIIADNSTQLAKKNIYNIFNSGIIRPRRVGDWCMKKDKMVDVIEVGPVIFTLTDVNRNITSQHCLGAEIETEDYLLGLNPGYVHCSPWAFYSRWLRDGIYHYTYGERGGRYIDAIIEKLRNDDTTRHAVIDLYHASKDLKHDFVPCTTQWAFDIRDGKLQMYVTMRSQDACRGFFLDTYAYPLIQRYIAKALKIEPGHYHHIILNSHIYADDIPFAHDIYHRLHERRPYDDNGIIEFLDVTQRQSMINISEAIFKGKTEDDFRYAQDIVKLLPPFWKSWKDRQIIYAYTRNIYRDKFPVELTEAGPMFNVMPVRKIA